MVRLCMIFALFLLLIFVGILFYNIFLKEWIRQIKLDKMFETNHNCKNCKHFHYTAPYVKKCDLNFYRNRDYVFGLEEKIYEDVKCIIGTRKCHWDPREETNV